jgi:hypothetical protein
MEPRNSIIKSEYRGSRTYCGSCRNADDHRGTCIRAILKLVIPARPIVAIKKNPGTGMLGAVGSSFLNLGF